MARVTPRQIDVHHHFLPRRYMVEEQERNPNYGHGRTPPAKLTNWTPERSIEVLDHHEIDCAIGSPSTPGAWFGDISAARRLTREWNEAGAQAVSSYPNRLGFFGMVAPPDTDGALKEIEYALDTLKADGISLMSNYDGKSLGDSSFAPVFEELNRRECVVYVHPTKHPFTATLIPDLMPQTIEFPFDTVRTITSLVVNGTLARCPNVKFIFSHGGGALPFLAARIAYVGDGLEASKKNYPRGIKHELRRLYCDTAFASSKPQLAAMLELFPKSNILYGSDYPFPGPEHDKEDLDIYPFSRSTREAIYAGNALELFPRFKAV